MKEFTSIKFDIKSILEIDVVIINPFFFFYSLSENHRGTKVKAVHMAAGSEDWKGNEA